MKTTIKRLARGSKAAIIGYKIYKNWRMSRQFKSGQINAQLGSTHTGKPLEDSLGYINLQFDDYLKYSSLSPAQLTGKRVLELGFGDSIGVALKFLAKGATEVVCVDKFYAKRDQASERLIYVALRNSLREEEQRIFDDAVNLEEGVRVNQSRIRCLYGTSLEQLIEQSPEEKGRFDLIISRAVIEEIYDPTPTFVAADRLLSEGGRLIHKIDLSDYGMFSGAGMHPLTFLTIPEWLYRRMASDSGLPNRRLIDYYRGLMKELGYEAQLFISSIIGVGEINPHREKIELNVDYGSVELALVDSIRPRLKSTYRGLAAGDLLINGIFLVAGKTPTSGPGSTALFD
jgi:Methyltransferase domain